MKMKDHYTNELGELLREKLDCGTIERKRVNIVRKTDMNKTIDETLEQRGKNYGDYRDVAYTAQELKKTLRYSKCWNKMEPFMQESMDMMCNKMARIVNGNPYYDDSWFDIGGYSTLVVKQLEQK